MNYHLVFEPTFDFTLPLAGLGIAVAGGIVARYRRSVGYGLLGGGLIFGLVTAVFLTYNYYVMKQAADDPATPTVSGVVQDFVAEPMDGHGDESFRVGDQRFGYSSFNHTGGFHRGHARGGLMRAGLPVRIRYLATEDGNLIVRLETGTPDGRGNAP
jgi:hypothetical protein